MYEPVLPANVPQPLDQELLAWAAGFFDGEGSTIAKREISRPGYSQLHVSVPQSGGEEIPEVLERFRVAALAAGRMGPRTATGMYAWRARGRIDSELILALMWPYLGQVKRAQATAAMAVVEEQYAIRRFTKRKSRYLPTFVPYAAVVSLADPTSLERAWVAGFLDAEGWFGVVRGARRKGGSTWLRIRASAPQHSADGSMPEVLLRLRQILGVGRLERHGEADDFKWVIERRSDVARVLEMTRPWLGTVKTMQAQDALTIFDAQVRVRNATATTCSRGHTYDRIVVTASGKIRKYCNACARLKERERRQERGAKPRQLRMPPADLTRAYAA